MHKLDQLLSLLRWKRLIFWNTAVVAVLAVLVALLLPKWYRATTSLFPPEDDSFSLQSLSSLLSASALAGGRGSLPVWATPSDVYAAILRSRLLREELIRRFDLVSVYKVKDVDWALRALEDKLTVKVGGEGVVTIHFLDKDPARAAEVANAAVQVLDRINREKRHTTASQARRFIESRLIQNHEELTGAEESLRVIQESSQFLQPDEQARAVISAAAEVEVQLLTKEVDLGVLEAQLGTHHPDRVALQREVGALRERLHELEDGRARVQPGGNRFEIPLREYPERSLRYFRALREVKVQQTVFEILTEQRERFRIQEMRDTPMVQVLDTAVPPTMKAKPIRWLICVSSTAIALLASVALAAALESLARLKRDAPDRFAALRAVFRELKLEKLLDHV